MKLEHRLLGAAATSTELARALVRANGVVNEKLFTDDDDKAVFATIESVLRDGKGSVMTPALVVERLGSKGAVISAATDADIEGAVTTFRADVAHLVQCVQARQLKALALEASSDINDTGGIRDTTYQAFRDLANAPDPSMLGVRRDTNFLAVAQRPKRPDRLVHFGFTDADGDAASYVMGGKRFAGGFRTSDLIVVGAVSGVGKTTWSFETAMRALWLFNTINNQHRQAMLFSAEQPSDEAALIAGLTKAGRWYEPLRAQQAEVHLLDQGDYGAPTVENVVAHIVEHVHSQVAADRKNGLSRAEIRGRLPLVIVVDYAKLFAPRGIPYVQGIESVAAILKQRIALGEAFDSAANPELDGYGPAVILPTQVKPPKVMAKADKEGWRPDLDDIADCRAIVDWADCVVLLHREDDQEGGPASMRLAKMRRARRSDWYDVNFENGRWSNNPQEQRQGFHAATAPWYLAHHEAAAKLRAERAAARSAS